MNKLGEVLEKLSGEIAWDNWEVEHVVPKAEKEYMKVTEVLHSRLEWMLDMANEGKEENAEHIETIRMLQELLEVIEHDNN